MTDYTTETRIFVGEPSLGVGHNYMGFQMGQAYELRYQQDSGMIVLLLDEPHAVAGMQMAIKQEQFERWWKPVRRAGEADAS